MPEINQPLPPVAPAGQPVAGPSIGPGPAQQAAGNVNLAGREVQALKENGGGGGFSIRKIFSLAVILVIAVSAYYVYFVKMAGAQSADYYGQVSGDFANLKGELSKMNKGLDSDAVDNSTSLEVSGGVFFDVTQSLDLAAALADAKEDLQKVQTVQNLVNESQQNRKKFRAGGDVGDLNKYYSKYLDNLEQGFGKLVPFENSRVEMLNVLGEDYFAQLNKILILYQPDVSRQEKNAQVTALADLAAEGVKKLKAFSAVSEDSKPIFTYLVESQEDFSVTFRAMSGDLASDDAGGDTAAISKMSELSTRQIERDKKLTEVMSAFVASSDTAGYFKGVVENEGKIAAEVDKLKEKYASGE